MNRRDLVRDRRAGISPRRLTTGAGHGALATVVMSAVMLAATAASIAPMPRPIPLALVAETFGPLPRPGLLVLAVLAHLGYGALAGVVLAALTSRRSLPLALGYGALLWGVMGLVWLPYIGWGLFGTAVTPAVAAATLVLHLVFGLTLGMLRSRRRAALTAGLVGAAARRVTDRAGEHRLTAGLVGTAVLACAACVVVPALITAGFAGGLVGAVLGSWPIVVGGVVVAAIALFWALRRGRNRRGPGTNR